MKLNTKYHGLVEYKEEDVIVFSKGLPGFEKLREFILLPIEEEGIFSLLHSLEDEEVGIPVVSPFNVYKDYEFTLSEETIKNLKASSSEDILVYTTVTINSNYENITTNLRAPIVVNIKEKVGEQIILEKDDYGIKYPIFQEDK